jgi:large subunit ribosomal protein L22
MSATAFLKNYRQTPRKVRDVANAIKGKSVEEAITILTFLPKRAAEPLKRLIQSAVASAKVQNETGELIVKDIRVDKGIVMRRSMPRARGSAAPIKKRLSHVRVVLDAREPKKAAKKASSKTK